MKYLLAIDIGNTNITIGLFDETRLVRKTKISTRRHAEYKALIRRFAGRADAVKSIVMSSVVPRASDRMRKTLGKAFKCPVYNIGKDVRVPVKNLYRVKRQVGQDRLVNAFAVKSLYGAPAVIIDFGTAVTFDIVSKKGEYLGGLIMPGIEMSLCGLYEKTALLPKVELKEASSIIGKDTVNSIRGGVLFGFGAMCDGLVSKYRSVLGGDVKVIATGGNADLVKRYAESIDTIDEDLTLKGINLLARQDIESRAAKK
ncbi:MAG: type III pantothenate kinase [Candidatus Omnitrophota bacterium]|nr:type III pantothenate kinase [Candidatus Omnitrophota bacterium]